MTEKIEQCDFIKFYVKLGDYQVETTGVWRQSNGHHINKGGGTTTSKMAAHNYRVKHILIGPQHSEMRSYLTK